MTTIICVHGTGAGDANDEGPRWWQRGSAFQMRLSGWLGIDPAQFEPFHWGSGPNSESERRKAGSDLLKRLLKFEAAGEDYVLLGHSHGGSVIHHALLVASARGKRLPRLRRWITIGTPFIWMKPRRHLFRRLTNIAKIAYLSALSSLVAMIIWGPVYYYYGRGMVTASVQAWGQPHQAAMPDEFVDFYLASQIVGPLIVVPVLWGLIMWSQRSIRRFYSKKGRTFFKREYVPRWQPFWSNADEAINALRATKPLKLSLFKRNLLTEPMKAAVVLVFTLFSLASFAMSMFYFAKYGLSPDFVASVFRTSTTFSFGLVPAVDVAGIREDPVDMTGAVVFASHHPIMVASTLLGLPLFIGVLFLVLSLFFGIVHWVAYLCGIPTSAFLNRLTADRLRNAAFGNDTIGEKVVQVAPVPEDCDETFTHLPEDVEKRLSAFCAEKAAITLERVREVLGVSEQLPDKSDIATTLAKELSSYELIHVAYFEVEEFARLVADALRDGCGSPNERLLTSEGAAETAA